VNDCTHGMPTPASCVTCMEDGNLPPAPRPEPDHVVATLRAQYEGQCPSCNLPIQVGAIVHKLEPSERYVHTGCAP
jgi:hypothetical protein